MSNQFSINGSFTLRTEYETPSENITECFSLDCNNCAAIIICSHDGTEISNLILDHLKTVLKSPKFISLVEYNDIKTFLENMFLAFDNKYLKNAEQYLKKRTILNERLSNIEFDSEFESLMKSIEEIERIFKCGCTLSLAILLNNILYVASIGDNQIIVLMDDDNNDEHRFLLLTEEHSFYNDNEIRRIKDNCELSANALSNLCGKSFSKYHSRCLGHYEMKREYMQFDNFRNSKASPLICIPHISEEYKINSKWCYLLFVSSGLYYIVMELIYDRDKIPGEIANEFLMTKSKYREKNLSEICEIVVRKYLESHKCTLDENDHLNNFEYEREELTIMAIELSVNDINASSMELDTQDSSISAMNYDTSSSGIYSSLTKSLTNTLPLNSMLAYVSFDSWITAEKQLSKQELEEIDLLLSSPLDDNVVIIEEDESMTSKYSRATTINEVLSIEENEFVLNNDDFLKSVRDNEEPVVSVDIRFKLNY